MLFGCLLQAFRNESVCHCHWTRATTKIKYTGERSVKEEGQVAAFKLVRRYSKTGRCLTNCEPFCFQEKSLFSFFRWVAPGWHIKVWQPGTKYTSAVCHPAGKMGPIGIAGKGGRMCDISSSIGHNARIYPLIVSYALQLYRSKCLEWN